VLIAHVTEKAVSSEQRSLTKTASAPSVSIPYRPYSSDKTTQMMFPDGIFAANYGQQYINVEPTNTGSVSLPSVSIYIEGSSDPNIVIPGSPVPVPEVVQPSASFKSLFLADFTNACSL